MIAITVSVNYADILKLILKQNHKFFDKWIIVTSVEDRATINLVNEAKLSNVELRFFKFKTGNSIFNKGGAIRMVQETIKAGETVLILDSDIYLPDNFLETVPKTLNDDTLYGVEKRNDFHTYKNFLANKVNYDFINSNYRHWVGFFQLYKADKKYQYKDSNDCSVSDMIFMRSFVNKRVISGLNVAHLGKNNVNWKGRKNRNDFIQ